MIGEKIEGVLAEMAAKLGTSVEALVPSFARLIAARAAAWSIFYGALSIGLAATCVWHVFHRMPFAADMNGGYGGDPRLIGDWGRYLIMLASGIPSISFAIRCMNYLTDVIEVKAAPDARAIEYMIGIIPHE